MIKSICIIDASVIILVQMVIDFPVGGDDREYQIEIDAGVSVGCAQREFCDGIHRDTERATSAVWPSALSVTV